MPYMCVCTSKHLRIEYEYKRIWMHAHVHGGRILSVAVFGSRHGLQLQQSVMWVKMSCGMVALESLVATSTRLFRMQGVPKIYPSDSSLSSALRFCTGSLPPNV